MSFTNIGGFSFGNDYTFNVGGITYGFSAKFITFGDLKNGGIKADGKIFYKDISNDMIEFFEWTNEANNLVLEGRIRVMDTKGDMSSFIGPRFSLVAVMLEMIVENSESNSKKLGGKGSVGSDGNIHCPVFNHLFFIDKAKVVEREGNAVGYDFNLKSVFWTRMISHVPYSNCDKTDENRKTKIYEIICEILKRAFSNFNGEINDLFEFGIDEESFKTVYGENHPELDSYITFTNDRVFDCIRYLQTKLYTLDKGLKNLAPGFSYVVFDEPTNKIKVIDVKKTLEGDVKNNNTYSDGAFVPLHSEMDESFVATTEQKIIHRNEIGFADSFVDFFKQSYNTYLEAMSTDEDVGLFELTPADISKFYNTKLTDSESSKNIPSLNFDFENEELYKMFFGDENGIFKTTEEYNYENDYSPSVYNDETYKDLFDSFLKKNVLGLEINGDISHRPGINFYVNTGLISREESNEISKDIDMNGIFHVIKVQHFVFPSNKDTNRFREKIYLVKAMVS